MTDYLGPLTLGTTSGTYRLLNWTPTVSDEGAYSAEIQVIVSAASSDALATAIEAFVAALDQGNSYFHYMPGVTSPTAYVIASTSGFRLEEITWQVYWQKLTVTLHFADASAGELQTPYSAHGVLLPQSELLNTLVGTNPPQLDVILDDTSTYDFHSIWVALSPTALADRGTGTTGNPASWLVYSSDLTWTTLSSGTGATEWGNQFGYTTSASWQTAQLNTARYPAGKYRLLARVSQSAGTGYVMDSQNQVAAPVTRTSWHIIVVGDLDLPVQDTAWGTASNLTFSVRSDGTNTFGINAFVLLPLSWGYFSWHPELAGQEIDQLDVGPTGFFMDGVTDTTYFQGGVLEPKTLAAHTGTLIATPNPTGNNWPSDWSTGGTGTVTADTSRFKIVTSAQTGWAVPSTYSVAVPGEWYQVEWTRQITAWTSGEPGIYVWFTTVDGSMLVECIVDQRQATDASPVAGVGYVKAPPGAARVAVFVGRYASGTWTGYWSGIAIRRCPLRLILVAEDSTGTLSSYTHAANLTVKYVPRYEYAR